MRLEGRIALVTGSARGIGRAIALAMAEEGATVVVNDIDPKTANSTAEEIKAKGHKATAVIADVTNSREVNNMVKTVINNYGKIDILVNCAGGSAREESSLFQDSMEEIWDRIINLNLKGALICTRAVLQQMINRSSGKIVNIASEAGKVGDWGLVDYSSAKAGLIGFTRALAREVSPYGINVNSVCPGTIQTRILEVKNAHYKEAIRRDLDKIVMKRMGTPEEVASAVVFLASDEASFITGEALGVDGGSSIGA